MTWTPTQDRVLLQVEPEVTETASGLSIGKSDKPVFNVGTIVAVGQISPYVGDNSFHNNPHSEIVPGRRAVFYKESGHPVLLVEDTENEYAVLSIADIYFVSENPEANLRAY